MSEVRPVCERYHEAVELIGARWSGTVILAMLDGHRRYAELKAAIPGISDTMLAQRLRELEGADLVRREVIPSTPVRVEYSLTCRGAELRPVVQALLAWSHKWITSAQDGDPHRCFDRQSHLVSTSTEST